MLLSKLLINYIGTQNKSVSSLSQEINIHPTTLRAILEDKPTISTNTMSKLLCWLLSSPDNPDDDNNNSDPVPAPVAPPAPSPNTASLPTPHRTAGRLVALSPRMQTLVNKRATHE